MARPINYYKNFQKLAKALLVDPNQLRDELLITEESLESWKIAGNGPSKNFTGNIISFIATKYRVVIDEKFIIQGWLPGFPVPPEMR